MYLLLIENTVDSSSEPPCQGHSDEGSQLVVMEILQKLSLITTKYSILSRALRAFVNYDAQMHSCCIKVEQGDSQHFEKI